MISGARHASPRPVSGDQRLSATGNAGTADTGQKDRETDADGSAADRRQVSRSTGRALLLVHLSLLVVAVSWGSNFVSIKYLLRSIGPEDVLLLRLTTASLCFGVYLVVTGGLPRFHRSDWPKIAAMAVLGITINTTTVAFGARLIPAAVGSLIVIGNPIFTAVISRVAGGEPLTRRKLAGISAAFVGFLVMLLFGGPEAHFSVQNMLGVLITLGGPVAWAFYTVFSKPMLARYEPTRFAAVVTIAGSLPLLPLLLVDRGLAGHVLAFGPRQWLAVVTSALFALVLSYSLWYRGLRVLSPTQIAVYIYLVPVFGTLGAWLILGERITAFLLVGGILILLGVIVTNTASRGGAGRVRASPRPGYNSAQGGDL